MRGELSRSVLSLRFLALVLLATSLGLTTSLAGKSIHKKEISFTEPIDLEVGRSPRSVIVGDFNMDGIADVAVANSGSNNVCILLGRGDGTFDLVQTVGVGSNPSFVTAGDFNGDGIPDLAVANSDSNTVSILLGNGDGMFESVSEAFRAGTSPSSVAIADFNGDGIADLAVANSRSNDVSILLGRGDGTFAPASAVVVGGSAGFVVAADFDADGQQDLAVAAVDGSPYRRGTVSILLGNGDGTFRSAQKLAVGRGLTSMVVHDFNEDGIADLAVAGNLTDTVSILLGGGDGTFALDRDYQVGGQPQSIAVGDFNSDGIPDLVTVGLYSTVSVLAGRGDGTFQPTRNYWGGPNPISVAVGNFNGEGHDDLVVAQNFSNQVSVVFNNSPQPGDGVTIVRDVIYYQGPGSNPARQNLDLYLPASKNGENATRQKSPVVVLTFGGMFRNGEKSRQAYLARTLARQGLVVVAINYRLTDGSSDQVMHPEHVIDAARAFAWTYHHIAEFGGDRENIVLIGHSSGGTLVSLLVTDRRYLADQGLSPDVVKGVIGVSAGTYDLRILSGFEDVFGDMDQQWDASPLRHVDGTQPPFLILYGDHDNPGFANDSTTFYRALIEAGSEAELHEIADRNHQMMIGNAARPGDPARELILRFIADHTIIER